MTEQRTPEEIGAAMGKAAGEAVAVAVEQMLTGAREAGLQMGRFLQAAVDRSPSR